MNIVDNLENSITLNLLIENEEIEQMKFDEIIQIGQEQTINQLKNFISDIFKIEILQIYHNFDLLLDETLAKSGLVDGDTINVYEKLHSVSVYSILAKGERNNMLYSKLESIQQFKKRIAQTMKINSDSFALFCNNENIVENVYSQEVTFLEDEKLMRDYKIEPTSHIAYIWISEFGNQIQLGNQISKSPYSSVYLAKDEANNNNNNNNLVLVIKKYERVEFSYKPLWRKLFAYARLRNHPTIVNFLAFYKDNSSFYVAMEFMKEGSLRDYLVKTNPVPVKLIRKWARQILEGLSYLHSNQIIHCDLKTSNILLSDNKDIKISGFNLSKFISGATSSAIDKGFVCSRPGTCNFMAPEVLIDQNISTKSDIWSLGAILIELVTGEIPFGKMAPLIVINNISTNKKIPYSAPERIPKELNDFIAQCLIADVETRWTVETLMGHEFLRD